MNMLKRQRNNGTIFILVVSHVGLTIQVSKAIILQKIILCGRIIQKRMALE